MPAGMYEYDGMFSVREMPWHENANVLTSHPTDVLDALSKSGTDWKVVQEPFYVARATADGMVYDPHPTLRRNVREDTGMELGIVTKKYKIRQNEEAFSFLGSLIESDMHFETGGSLFNGRIVYVTCKMPEWITVAGDPSGIFGFVTNHHGGWQSTKAKITVVRVVCANTHHAALADGRPIMSIPHFGDLEEKVIKAQEFLGLTSSYSTSFKDWGDALGRVKLSEKSFDSVLEQLFPVTAELTDRQKVNVEDRRNYIKWMWREGKTCNELCNAPGTAWSAFNAVTEYVDFGETSGAESAGKLMRAMDDTSGLKQKATDLFTDLIPA